MSLNPYIMIRTLLIALAVLHSALSFAQTQAEMTLDARKKLEKAEGELNLLTDQIMQEYRDDTVFVRNFRASQKLWLQFRKTELLMKYPQRDPSYYGSSFSMCVNLYLEELTRERIRKLTSWIEPDQDGDMCAGSVK
jgi:uncharacterized protein YecT (DUF1311 family)